MNRWIYLTVVFIVSGCGVSHEVHQTVLDQLAKEEKERQSIGEELVKISVNLGETKGYLQYIQKEHTEVNNKLDSMQVQYGEMQAKLDLKEDEYHRMQTQLDLKIEQYENAQLELAGVKSEYEKRLHTKTLTPDECFDLGAALVKLGIKEKEAGNDSEAKQLFSRAVIPLEKLLDHKPFADAHYYLARAYYGIREFKKARAEAKKAVRLAKETYQEAQAILDRTAD